MPVFSVVFSLALSLALSFVVALVAQVATVATVVMSLAGTVKERAKSMASWSARNRVNGVRDFFRNLRVRWVSGAPLSPAVQGQINEYLYLRPTLASMQEESTWCVDEFILGEDFLEIRGWAITPFDEYAPAAFTLNGVPFEEVDYPRLRADVANVFWFRFGCDSSAFICRTPIPDASAPETRSEKLFPNGFAELQFCDARTQAPFRNDHGFYFADPVGDEIPYPEANRRNRVHGNTDLASFQLQGASAFVKLEQALNKSCGKSFSDFPRVLDWGCGCGRITRHFRKIPACTVTGIDIDESNVAWSADHFDFAQFATCDVDPPIPYPEESFDLVFGVSVMTHLSEPDRMGWLRELDRVCSPGAILLLTIQSDTALCRTAVRTETLIRYRQRGALDVDTSLAAEDLSTEPTRYIDCFLSADYVHHRWSEVFDVLDVIPGYIGNVQDLVVLRKRDA